MQGQLPSFMLNNNRISNGNMAKGAIPWVVALWIPMGDGKTMCTGTILDSLTILTARHCIIGHPKIKGKLSKYYVKAGSPYSEGGIMVSVKRIILLNDELWTNEKQTKYGDSSNRDMAILKLNHPLPLSQDIMPLCLPDETFKYYYGTHCFIAGWGITGTETRSLSWSKTQILPSAVHGLCTLEDNIFCTMSTTPPYGSTCSGDSGSSLVCMQGKVPVLAGVLNGGTGCGKEHSFKIWTKTVPYFDWINHYMVSYKQISGKYFPRYIYTVLTFILLKPTGTSKCS